MFCKYPAPRAKERDGVENEAPIGRMISELLDHLDTHKSMGLDGIHPRILKDMLKVLPKPLSIIYH